jgi:hypothetical protein
MSTQLLDLPRIAVCSLLAFLTCACARWSQADSPPGRPDPRIGHGPSLGTNGVADVDSADSHIQLLQTQISAMEADLVHLRFALDRMGVAGKSAPTLTSARAPQSAAVAASSDLFAPPPKLANAGTLFYEADLSVHADRASAEGAWSSLSQRISLPGLAPRITETHGQTLLSVGPLTSADAVEALCAQIVTFTGVCKVGSAVRYNP